MNILLIFAWIYAAMIATSFWESRAEGDQAWDKGKIGWKIHWKGRVVATEYHFWLFFVAYPLLILLPLAISGFSWQLFGVLMSAYLTGMIVEDIFWFVVNPEFKLRNYGPEHVTWFYWVGIGKFKLPVNYFGFAGVAILFWIFLWA